MPVGRTRWASIGLLVRSSCGRSGVTSVPTATRRWPRSVSLPGCSGSVPVGGSWTSAVGRAGRVCTSRARPVARWFSPMCPSRVSARRRAGQPGRAWAAGPGPWRHAGQVLPLRAGNLRCGHPHRRPVLPAPQAGHAAGDVPGAPPRRTDSVHRDLPGRGPERSRRPASDRGWAAQLRAAHQLSEPAPLGGLRGDRRARPHGRLLGDGLPQAGSGRAVRRGT